MNFIMSHLMNLMKFQYGVSNLDSLIDNDYSRRIYGSWGCVLLCACCVFGNDIFDIGKYFSFKLPYFQDNLNMMIVTGAIYGVVRTVGAIGLLKNKMWGFMLSVINCIITMILMLFLLPAGIMDGVFASGALILMLTQYYGNKEIGSN